MKNIILTLALLLLVSCTTSKRVSFLTLPEETISVEDNININEYLQKYAEYDGVYINIEENIEHAGTKQNLDIFNNWSYTRVWKKKYMIINPDATWLTSFSLYSFPDKFYVRVTSPDGVVKKYDKVDFKEEKSIDGFDTKRLIFPDIVKGSIVEIGYENSFQVSGYPPPLDHDIDLQFRIPCENFTFKFLYPAWWTLQIKMMRSGVMCPGQIIEDPINKKNILQYTKTDIPALRWEPYSPEFKQVANYLQFMVTDMEMGSGKMNRPEDWQELAERFYDNVLKKSDHKKIKLNPGDAPLVDKNISTLKELVEIIVKDKETEIEKIDAILTYIQDNIEVTSKSYDGNNSKIISKKNGNRYDVTALTKNMLEELGFETNFLLVHSAVDGFFDASYIDHDQLYIPAVRVITSSDAMVLFPYISDLPIGHTPSFFQGEQAIVINQKAPIDFWQIPKGNSLDNSDLGDYEISISDDGVLDVVETKTLSGSIAYTAREQLKDLDDEETQKKMKDLITYSDGNIEWVSYEIKNLDNRHNNLILQMHYKIDNLVTITPEEVILQTAGLFSPITDKKYKLDPKDRQNPIFIDYNQQYSKHIYIHYPMNWRLNQEFVNIADSNLFGSITKTHTLSDGEIIIDQKLSLQRTESARENYKLLLDLTDDNSSTLPAIIFEVKQS